MKVLLMILQFMPTVLQAIVAVEGVVGGGKGQTKKQLVMNAITAAAQVGEKADNKTVAALSGLVDTTVSTLNSSGIFGSATTTPTPTTEGSKTA